MPRGDDGDHRYANLSGIESFGMRTKARVVFQRFPALVRNPSLSPANGPERKTFDFPDLTRLRSRPTKFVLVAQGTAEEVERARTILGAASPMSIENHELAA